MIAGTHQVASMACLSLDKLQLQELWHYRPHVCAGMYGVQVYMHVLYVCEHMCECEYMWVPVSHVHPRLMSGIALQHTCALSIETGPPGQSQSLPLCLVSLASLLWQLLSLLYMAGITANHHVFMWFLGLRYVQHHFKNFAISSTSSIPGLSQVPTCPLPPCLFPSFILLS